MKTVQEIYWGRGNRPFLRVYSVSSADSREVTKTLDAMIPGVVVNEDARNHKIHIFGHFQRT